ncbi:pkb-activating kinase-like protein [Actinomortierella ambigua]|uniref:non-specific serine/threonine protein kinase n=1 Tax=Actinomortierella ambigua TaxID=1343610 RepID=A0A9P6QC60_9FUNG|nr:pkb-activating kinase-like protein [Actinomortierella ambigua]
MADHSSPSSSSSSTQSVEAVSANQHANGPAASPDQQGLNNAAELPLATHDNTMPSNNTSPTNDVASPAQTASAEASTPPTGPQPAVRKRTLNDYRLGRTLGEGSYSTVVAAIDLSNGREYAIKVLDKRHIIREKKVKYVNIEKNVLYKLDHPGVVKLYSTFQDNASLYYVLEVCNNGELLTYIKKLGSFDENCTQFYAAQIFSAVEYVHSQGVIHRDLKPENILMDSRMYIKLTDFGTAKILDPSPDSDRANSFVGTAEYVSPELLTEKSACKSSDWWALGCIIYQLLAGRPPFKGSNEYQTFQKIVKLEYSFPPGFPRKAMDIVSKLLVLDPSKRLGGNGNFSDIKTHEFYDGVDWSRLWQDPAPRLLPYLPPTPTHNQEPLRSDHDPASDLWTHLDRIVERKLDEMIQNGEVDAYEGHEEQPVQRRVVNADVHYSDDDDDGQEPDDGIAYADPQDEYMRQLALNGQQYQQQQFHHQSYHHNSYNPPALSNEYQHHPHHPHQSPQPLAQPLAQSVPAVPMTNSDRTVPSSPSQPVVDTTVPQDGAVSQSPSPKAGNKKSRNVFAALFSSSPSTPSQDKQGTPKSSKRQSRQSIGRHRASRDMGDRSIAGVTFSSMAPLSGSTFESTIPPISEAMTRENSSMSLGVTAQEVNLQTRKARLELQSKFSPWSKFLLPDELVLYQSPILKRKAFFSKSCFLVLTDYPRLLYFDDSNHNFRRQFYSNTIAGFSYSQQLQIRHQLLQIQPQTHHQPSVTRLSVALEEGEELTPPPRIGNGGASVHHAPSSNTSLSSLHLQPPAMLAATTPASSCSSSSISLAPPSSVASKGHAQHQQQPPQHRLSISGSPAMTPLSESPPDRASSSSKSMVVPMRPAQRPRPPPPKPPLKGEVQLLTRPIIELKGKKCFFIHTSKKSLYFEEVPLPSSVTRGGGGGALLMSSASSISSVPASPLPTASATSTTLVASASNNSNATTVIADSPSTSTLGTINNTQSASVTHGGSSGASTPNPTHLQPVSIGDAKTWVHILQRTISDLVEELSS